MSFSELNPNIYLSDAAMEQFLRQFGPEEIGALPVRTSVILQYDGTEDGDHQKLERQKPDPHWENMLP